MKIQSKLLVALFTIGTLLISQSSFATLVITLNNGKNQGDQNCIVTKQQTDCGTATAMVSASCSAGGSEKCPTNEDLRAGCSGAIVVWVSNTYLDYEVGNIQSLWNGGSGQTSGSYTRNYYNTDTQETVSVSYSWVTISGGGLRITIDEV